MNEQRRLDVGRADDAELLWQGINEGRDSVRGDNRVRMTIEGDHDGDRFVLAGIGNRLANDLLVPEMHSVENDNRAAYLARSRIQFTDGSDDLHSLRKGMTRCSRSCRQRP